MAATLYSEIKMALMLLDLILWNGKLLGTMGNVIAINIIELVDIKRSLALTFRN